VVERSRGGQWGGGVIEEGGETGTYYKLPSVPSMFWITSQRMIVSPASLCGPRRSISQRIFADIAAARLSGAPFVRGPRRSPHDSRVAGRSQAIFREGREIPLRHPVRIANTILFFWFTPELSHPRDSLRAHPHANVPNIPDEHRCRRSARLVRARGTRSGSCPICLRVCLPIA